jgi:ribonuclease E
MKKRVMMVSLAGLLVASQASLVQADGLVDVNPIPELADLEKQAQAQEEKAKAFAEEMAKKNAEQKDSAPKSEPSEPVAEAKPERKAEVKPRQVETTVSKSEPQPETKTFTTTAGSTTIINNATGPQSVVVNINGEPKASTKPKSSARKKPKIKKPEPEGPVDLWTAQERQYAYP